MKNWRRIVGREVIIMYIKFITVYNCNLLCLGVFDDDFLFWQKRLGYVSFFLLNKFFFKYLVVGLFLIKFQDNKVCDICVLSLLKVYKLN